MANECKNTLIVRGSAANVNDYREAFMGFPVDWDNHALRKNNQRMERRPTFNALVPVPKEIIDVGYELHGDINHKNIMLDEMDEYLNSEVDGYTWCINNWGNKWDIYHQDVQPTGLEQLNEALANNTIDKVIEITYRFVTAWDPCIEFVTQIGSMYPLLEFELIYVEEGLAFVGRLNVKNEKIQHDQIEKR